MQYIKWVLVITFWVLVLSFLHYTLPQRDIVRITDTYERRIDFGENAMFWAQADAGADGTLLNRDVFFIQTKRANDKVMVYRNEDTAWGWPPYFKFDSSNLQAEASDLRSTAADAQWALVTHYGWRNEFLSIFPNAISIRAVDGPDVSKGVPWTNIVILTLLAAVYWAIYVRWRRFRQSRIDPQIEALEDAVDERRAKLSGWFKRNS